MNIYHSLNELIAYIEDNLDNPISYKRLSQFLGVNEYTMQSIFSLLCNISLSEYIRKRRLSDAGTYLYSNNAKIIDVALKYQYENPASFSRAFENFHGIKPSEVKDKYSKLRLFPKLHFNEDSYFEPAKFDYSIVYQDELVLYGVGFKTKKDTIFDEVPSFFKTMYEKYSPIYGDIEYGMTIYEDNYNNNQDRFTVNNYEYWILYNKVIPEFQKQVIPKSKWLCFHIPSENANDIQKLTKQFYLSFLPSCKYNIRPIPELEHYTNGETDFLVPID